MTFQDHCHAGIAGLVTVRDGGRLDRPPHPDAAYRLSDSFGRRFMVFVDVEEEFDWSRPPDRLATATTAIAFLPELHRHIASHGVKPVYLIDYPIADCPRSAEILRSFIEAEEASIGAHLHAWVNPPFDEVVSNRNSFAGNLPVALERAKLHALTDRIETAIGVRPLCYRSGRYGVGPATAMLLEEAGYRIDLSVRAHFDYSSQDGPDFSHCPVTPYRAGPSGRLLAIPLGSTYLGRLRRFGPRFYGAAGRVPLARAVLARWGLMERIALTPEDMPVDKAMEAVRVLDGEGLRLFSLSYHSPSAAPGHTPYVRDRADLHIFYDWWDKVLGLFQSLGITGAGLDDVLADLDGQDRGLR